MRNSIIVSPNCDRADFPRREPLAAVEPRSARVSRPRRFAGPQVSIEWVMERQAVTTDKDSGIVNDANLWTTETMHNPRYSLELLQRVITVSLETMKLVNNLPKLDID